MEMEPRRPAARPGFAELFVVLGGGAAVIGSLLDWFRIRIGLRGLGLAARTVTQRGVDNADGKITLVAGIVVVAMGVLMFLWGAGRQRLAMGAIALLGGLTALALAGYDAATPRQRFIASHAPSLARSAHIPVSAATRLYEGLFRSGTVRISLAVGIVVVIVGGAVAAIAAGFVLGKSPQEPEPARAAPPSLPTERIG